MFAYKTYDKTHLPIDFVAPYHPDKDVGMGEWRTSEEVLFTTGASNCIILAAHNTVSKKGLLGHFVSVGSKDNALYNDRNKFDAAVEAIKTLGPSLRHVEIWLGGGSPHYKASDPEIDITAVDRDYAKRSVESFLTNNDITEEKLNTKWCGIGRVVDIELNCREEWLIEHDHPALLFV